MATSSTTALADYISTLAAAQALGYTLQHTRLLIRQGKLKAEKLGRDWLVSRRSVVQHARSGGKTNGTRQQNGNP